MKKFVALMLSIVLVFALVACGQKEEAPAPEAGGAPAVEENKPVTLKYSDLNAETSHTGIYAKKFKEIVEATNGRVVPLWLEANKEDFSAKIVRMPVKEDLDYEVEEHLIVELYSK